MPKFYMLNGYKSRNNVTIYNPQIFCEIHQQLEDVDFDVYVEWCKANAEAVRFGMKAVYECSREIT